MHKSLVIWAGLSLLTVTSLARADEPTLSVSIAVAAINPGTERVVAAFDRHSHFHVILTNTSDEPQRIVTEWNSWGDQALSFEFSDESGKTWVARRVLISRSKNMLSWWILEPHENLVFDVYFADPERWRDFPHPLHYGDSQAVTMRAVFEIKPNEVPPKEKLWTGRVVSKRQKYAFHNRTGNRKIDAPSR
ncbi:MAG TPA: hypothetical protein VFW87_21650 [Pirellulales bacterium]|nr:hypothetical protein [Pirellulales bacterium]